MAPPTVLVTGSRGALGHAVCERLAREGIRVVAVYRHAAPVFAPELAGAIECRRADLARDDLGVTFDFLFHAAAASPGPGIGMANFIDDNIESTRRLLGQARAGATRRIIYASSVSAFGEIGDDRLSEATPSVDPAPYGLSKLVAEHLLLEQAGAMGVLILRLPALLGPGAARNFLAAAAHTWHDGGTVKAFNPDQPFNNAADVADIAPLAHAYFTAPTATSGMAVLGAAGMTTVAGAMAALARGMGIDAAIDWTAAPRRSFVIDSTRAQREFGYRPQDILAMIEAYGRTVRAGSA